MWAEEEEKEEENKQLGSLSLALGDGAASAKSRDDRDPNPLAVRNKDRPRLVRKVITAQGFADSNQSACLKLKQPQFRPII